MAAPLACVALPLWVSLAQESERGGRGRGDDQAEGVEDSGPAQARFTGPVHPASARIEDAQRERSDPFLVPIQGGGALLGCLEYEVGAGDRIVLRPVEAGGTLAKAPAPVFVLNGEPRPILRPVAALDGRGRVQVVFTEIVEGVAQLGLAAMGGDGQWAITPLTSGPRPNRNPEIAGGPDGSPWVAWERWREGGARGSFDVVAAPLADGALGEPVVVGDGPGADLDAVVAVSRERVAVAWCSWRGRDYEILLRTLDRASGALSGSIAVSGDALADDVHPSIAAADDGSLWIAWDRFEDVSRGRSTPNELRADLGLERLPQAACSVRVACVRGGEVFLPSSSGGEPGVVAGAPLHSFSGGTPRLVAGAGGRIDVVCRFLARQGPGGRAYGFPVMVSTIDAAGIGAPVMLESSAGGPEEPAACASGSGLLVAWQQDHRLEVETGTLMRSIPRDHFRKLGAQDVVVTGSLAPSGIGVARLERTSQGAATATEPRVARLEPPHFHPAGESLDEPIVSGAAHFEVKDGERTWRVYFGDLHRHSSVSRCSRGFEPAPPDRWHFGRDASLYDFMALTDHSCHVDALGWWRLHKVGETAGSPGFVALAGFEWSTGLHGHQNVILRGSLRPYLSNMLPELGTPEGLHAALDPATALAIPHHPADVTRRTDFARCDDSIVRLVEVYQAQRGSYEFDGCFKQSRHAHAVGSFAHDALARGLKVGFVASTDHGEGASYACALAHSLDRGAIFDALRARRTYGATAKGMLIVLRADGRLMGEEVRASGPPAIALRAIGAAEIAEAVVYRNGEPWRLLGRGESSAAARTELTVELEVARPAKPRADDWRVTIKAPGASVKPWFELPGYAKDDLGPDRPQWRAVEDGATHVWKGGYAGFWEPLHSRLRLAGPRATPVQVIAFRKEGDATSRSVTLGELAAGAEVGGDSPLGPWKLGVRESPDAAVDCTKGLGVRELEREWTDDSLPAGTSWYAARVIQVDGEIAWSSPVWVTR